MNECSLAPLLASLFYWWAKSGSPSPRDRCYSNPVLAPGASPALRRPLPAARRVWRQQRNLGVVEGMGDTVVDDCPQALVEERFKDITAGGIFLENDINGIGPARFTAGRFSRRRYVDTRW